jgi:TonB family protein
VQELDARVSRMARGVMFERYADDRGGEPWRWRWRRVGPAVALAIAAHVGGLAGLLVDALWHVDRLEIADQQVELSIGTGAPLPLPQQAAAAAPAARPERPRRRPRVTRNLVQPDGIHATTAPAKQDGPEEASLRGERGARGLKLFGECSSGGECVPNGLAHLLAIECGNGRVEPGEECDDGGRVDRDGCSALCSLERRVKVDNRVMEGYRIAGDPQIHAPEAVRDRMAEHGQTGTLGAVEMCLGTDGSVSSLRLRRSTGYAEYDAALVSGMKGWRYRPYRLADGTGVRACTLVTFIYRMTIHQVAASRSRLR